MKLVQAHIIKEAVEMDMECQVHEEYSGRGMYGEVTAGVSVEDPVSAIAITCQFIVHVVIGNEHSSYFDKDSVEEVLEEFEHIGSDSLGLSTILY